MILFAAAILIAVLLGFIGTIAALYVFERRKRTQLLGCGGSKHPLTVKEIRAIEERVADRPADE